MRSEALRIFSMSMNSFTNIEQQANVLINRIVSGDEVEKFLNSIIGINPAEKISTRKENQKADLERLFLHGRGNHGRTAYDLVNSVTEYYQHEVNPENPEARLASTIAGTGAKKAEQAVKLALALAE